MFRKFSLAVLVVLSLLAPPSSASASPVDRNDLLDRAKVAQPVGMVSSAGDVVGANGIKIRVRGFEQFRPDRERRVSVEGSEERIAQAIDGGIQLVSVHRSRAVEHRQSYGFPGHRLVANQDGSVLVISEARQEAVALIQAPWARDAVGDSVRTFYVVDGSWLTQVVQPGPTSRYPIVADPTVVKKWYGSQVRFSRGETATIAEAASACGAILLAVPEPLVSKWASVICGVVGIHADLAMAAGKCVAVNVWVTGQVTPWYWNC